eukprot:2665977-Amphidinium_carterae.1
MNDCTTFQTTCCIVLEPDDQPDLVLAVEQTSATKEDHEQTHKVYYQHKLLMRALGHCTHIHIAHIAHTCSTQQKVPPQQSEDMRRSESGRTSVNIFWQWLRC